VCGLIRGVSVDLEEFLLHLNDKKLGCRSLSVNTKYKRIVGECLNIDLVYESTYFGIKNVKYALAIFSDFLMRNILKLFKETYSNISLNGEIAFKFYTPYTPLPFVSILIEKY
jgi:hypothetical protein